MSDRAQSRPENRSERRRGDRRAGSNALVPTLLHETVDDGPSANPAVEPTAPDPAFVAQVIGQSGQKRGLKGGQPVLEAARSAYLGAEHSGQKERRPRVGQVKRTEI